MNLHRLFNPFSLPIILFAVVILLGAFALQLPVCSSGDAIPFIDALFTSASATCVTGLIVLDTSGDFSRTGQCVILLLIQLGGLGIMTYASLIFYLWRRRISLRDRAAVGSALLNDTSFNLGRFLLQIVFGCFLIELVGAGLLYAASPSGFPLFSALFHSVSAFCNAGFSLNPNSLIDFRGNLAVNLVLIALIVLGGLGFAVLLELLDVSRGVFAKDKTAPLRLSWHSSITVKMTWILILFGWVGLFITERLQGPDPLGLSDSVITALFQSVTCRTAGFNSIDISQMTNLSLMIMLLLMFVGGSSGSCAGGIKTTTFAALLSFIRSQLLGRKQVVIGRFALSELELNKTLSLTVFALAVILGGAFLLTFTDGAHTPHSSAGGTFLEILFEVVSAFATVGLSTGITPSLSTAGKCIIILLMFIGRLGPIVFLSMIAEWRREPRYQWPENTMMIG
ncbi:MAG: potassium transporter TrkG [Candidatus Hinthialibacter antarcticus]|nr:potassium transporter TrkG [Candidatus Hinthialibacter antarcticus]